MVKFVKSDDRYLANKLNLFSAAVFLHKSKAMKYLRQNSEMGTKHRMLTTLEGDTLI
jgi:hypothetical protein